MIDEQSQDAVASGEITDSLNLLVSQTLGDEQLEAPFGPVAEDAERGVSRLDEVPGDLDDPVQQLVQRKPRGHGDDCIQQEAPPDLLVPSVLDPTQDLCQQLVERR